MPSFHDTRHLWILLGLIILAGWAGLVVRERLVPRDFGRTGPYRAAALAEIAAHPSVFLADSVCHECHQEVERERADTLHKAVRCVHCHGVAQDHVAHARLAAADGATSVPAAARWDGDFDTHTDLFISRDRKLCLSCHEAVVGMPADFKKIDVAQHLADQGAADPESRETCFECHGGHNTKP